MRGVAITACLQTSLRIGAFLLGKAYILMRRIEIMFVRFASVF